ncbi:anti-sigma regulatory factor (Ser/Thr protein kinase) [Nonomuraea thailandensis]|uniref:Anti-sigma regulatory factor (Ser/Thr protein kinase) n=1 Tax=Nonomuraea thailandensis TaxID=1188745 RepID=A0A9X2K3P3_9ACTN|nr:ATP-binding protein [Nonomuraea thailandensis]MCP2358375.1 anti-sigma regulatory factor (Ser/Thr protein kinase) [Nonomuraea thailandensis]
MSAEFELRCPISANLAFVRDLIRVHGRHSGLRGQRLDDLVLVVNEAVANVLDHGAGMVTARNTAEGIVVEILYAAGKLTHDHLAGADHLDLSSPRGFGLRMIRRLCDEIRLEQTGLGSLLSLHVHRRPVITSLPRRHITHHDQDARRAG